MLLHGLMMRAQLLNCFSDMLGSERKYNREMTKTERDHTTQKLAIITQDYNSRLNTSDNAIKKLIDNQVEMLEKSKLLNMRLKIQILDLYQPETLLRKHLLTAT